MGTFGFFGFDIYIILKILNFFTVIISLSRTLCFFFQAKTLFNYLCSCILLSVPNIMIIVSFKLFTNFLIYSFGGLLSYSFVSVGLF